MIISLFSKLKWLAEDIEYVSDSTEYLLGSDVKIEYYITDKQYYNTYNGNTTYSVIAL